MDSKRSPSIVPRSFHVDPATTSSAYIATIKAKLDDVEHRRGRACVAMRDRLHALIVEYKRADQGFVDEHAAYLNQLSARCPDEVTSLDWVKPCLGVPDRELFARGGIAIKYHPLSDPSGLGPQVRGPSPSPSAQQSLSPLLATSGLSSTLSSAPPSPGQMPDPETPTSKPIAPDKPTLPLLPRKRSATATSPSSSSSDELTSDLQPPPQPETKKRSRPIPHTPTSTSRKPLRTSRRGRQTANDTTHRLASMATQNILPAQKKDHQGQAQCFECASSRQECDRELPCSACVQKRRVRQCRYPKKRSKR
ncbi:hypothetical protein B0T18DRAFT_161867 [Schizothecium vesticola]|uniref:Zn(2)-C6 fungal-type domain-containing protein n=1 Tax=Schizothecium vesticola TaxID=314040 RepID=A0AA40EWI7_9PEZI|nr:hypothetical protein B0T18DRAFT_161867 [Schizothecium vesticola]